MKLTDIRHDYSCTYQHNGTPHFSKQAMEYLNELFHDCWIGRVDLQNRPTWSPDFTMLDFRVMGLHEKYSV